MTDDGVEVAEFQPEDPRSGRRPVDRVIAVSVVLFALAAALLVVTGDLTRAIRPAPVWFIAALAVGFAVAERFAFHVEYQREAISFTISEVPAAMALVFLSPIVAVTTRVVVGLVIFWFELRPPAYKMIFNAGLFAFEAALAIALIRLIVDPATVGDVDLVLATGAALMVSTIIGSVAVSAVIAQFEGDLVSRLVQQIRINFLTTPIVVTLGAMAVAPALVRPIFVLVPLVPLAAVWTMMRRFGRLSQDHRDLEAVHGFARVIGEASRVDDVASIAITEACRLLRAGSGFLQVYDHAGELVTSAVAGTPTSPMPCHIDDPLWRPVYDHDAAETFDRDVRLSRRGTMIAAPIRDDDGLIGLLVAEHRTGAAAAFEPGDVSRADTLVAQLSSTLRRALLHTRMEHAALHDDLTGEWNRLAFSNAIEEAGERLARDRSSAVLMLDLDRFKEINDALGHHVGDRVLVEFTARIRAHLAEDDLIARFGGDEFGVLVERANFDLVRDLADELVALSFAPMTIDDLEVVLTASVGVTEITQATHDSTEVLRQADVAMYTAKREQTRVEIYRPDIDHQTPDRLSLLVGLRDVLERNGLEVHYQPKVDLVTSTVIGSEALVRWEHPTRGWIPPNEFVRVAEESGLIKQLTDQVLTLAIGAVAEWWRNGYDLGVAVNISTHDLLDEGLPQRVRSLLEQFEVSADKLTLEITESALLADTPRTRSTIDRLDQLGVRLSLDDFGTGYSSLGYLRRLPVAELKVDQSFVKNVLLDAQDEAIVRSTIDLGHNLGLQVVAEGIENEPVLDRLRNLGCDLGQGYGISRPLSPPMFATWLRTTQYRVLRRDSLLAT